MFNCIYSNFPGNTKNGEMKPIKSAKLWGCDATYEYLMCAKNLRRQLSQTINIVETSKLKQNR